MKTTFQAALLSAAIFPFAAALEAQCNFDPTVTGNLLLCPESTSVLGTQQYDAYKWYTVPTATMARPSLSAARRRLLLK